MEDKQEELLLWAVSRWFAEVADRPMQNIHRRTLDETWRQVIKKLGGNPDELIGTDHLTLLMDIQYEKYCNSNFIDLTTGRLL